MDWAKPWLSVAAMMFLVLVLTHGAAMLSLRSCLFAGKGSPGDGRRNRSQAGDGQRDGEVVGQVKYVARVGTCGMVGWWDSCWSRAD